MTTEIVILNGAIYSVTKQFDKRRLNKDAIRAYTERQIKLTKERFDCVMNELLYQRYTLEFDTEKTLEYIETVDDVPELIQFLKLEYELPIENQRNQHTIGSVTDLYVKYLFNTFQPESIVLFLEQIQRIVNKQTTNLNTLSKRFTNHRNLLKKRFGTNHWVVNKHKCFGMTTEQHEARQTTQQSNLIKAHQNILTVNSAYIADLINKWKTTDDLYKQIATGLIASGLRPVELCVRARIDLIQGNHVTFSGLAKGTKDSERPILFLTPTEFETLMKVVQQKVSDCGITMSNISANLKNLIDANNLPIYKPYEMRKVYANSAYQQYGNVDESLLSFTNKVLNHSSLSSTLHYTHTKQTDEIKTNNDTLVVKNIHGEAVEIPILNKHSIRGETIRRLRETIELLHKAKVRITGGMLRRFKFGYKPVNQMKDTYEELNNQL